MRFADLLGLALSALRQQKVRTALTTLGVVFGSLVLVASLSVRQGVNETVVRQWGRWGDLRRIDVRPDMMVSEEKRLADKIEVRGTMSEARRERLRRQLTERRDQEREQPPPRSVARVPLDRERLRAIAALDHVRSAAPLLSQEGQVTLDGEVARAFTLAAPADDEAFRKRVIAGDYLPATGDDCVVVTEYLLYLLGRRDEADMAKVVGGKLRLEYRTGAEARGGFLRLFPRPRGGEVAKEFTICGVLRTASEAETRRPWGWLHGSADVLLPAAVAQELFFRMPGAREHGFGNVSVEVDSLENVKEVNRRIRAMGLQTESRIGAVEKEQFTYRLIFTAMTVVAVVALLVSALGMINTMLMSVLERVREIGVMKAVGARDGHILTVFLIEGALVGLVGGVLGLLAAWGLSFPGDAWVRSTVESGLSIKLQDSVFVFPWWLVTGVPAFACLVTTLAALYPARRASRVNPIAALRHD